MCDTCGQVFSVLDIRSRRIQVEEPVITNGTARSVQTVQRDMCGPCFDMMNASAITPVASLPRGED